MKRLAILLGAPSHQSTPNAGPVLKGVNTDILNMKKFLFSSIGGSWKSDEVKTFDSNPNFSEIYPFLSACKNVDMAFIYFSGHGYTDPTHNPRVLLNQNEHPDVFKHFANLAKKQITIVDACRSYPRYVGFDGVLLKEGIDFPNPKPVFARSIYDHYVSKLPDSKVLLFSSSKGESSLDYGENLGGLFSSSLLSVVKSKLKLEKKAIYKIIEVFNSAKINTQINEPNQRPEIKYSNNDAYNLPFAINPDLPFKEMKNSTSKMSESGKIIKRMLIGGGIILAVYGIGKLIKNAK